MILRFGARCRCHAEMVGTLHAIAVEPHERVVLQLVVEQPQASPLVRVRAPFGLVEAADADHVALAMTAADFRALPPFGTTASRTPRRPDRGNRPAEGEERILTARSRVECRDGLVGNLSHVLVDPRSGDITGFAFPFGVHFQRNIHVGVEHLEAIGGETLTLRIDMDEIETLPALRP